MITTQSLHRVSGPGPTPVPQTTNPDDEDDISDECQVLNWFPVFEPLHGTFKTSFPTPARRTEGPFRLQALTDK